MVRGRFVELRDEWLEGARVALSSHTVRVLATFWTITSFGEGIWGTLFAPYVRSVLHGGPEALGVISGIQAVGGVVGGLVVATFGSSMVAAPDARRRVQSPSGASTSRSRCTRSPGRTPGRRRC